MQGMKLDHVELFKGIPYAKARRFQQPELCTFNPEGNYTNWPSIAWQNGFMPGTFYDKEFYSTEPEPPMSEDCLYLNIWKPEHAHNASVALWIHGGGFDHGYSYEKEFDGTAFAKDGIILVSIAYRVGLFGFYADLEHPEQCNLGLQDQAAALQWVYKNIHHFGGDPNHITIFGQSAGCMSVACLLSKPDLNPMIHGAILQSGLGIDGVKDLEEAHMLFQEFMTDNHLSQKDLYTMEASSLIEMQSRFLETHPLAFAPCLDGNFLTSRFEQAKLPDIPLLFGSCWNDIFTDPQTLSSKNRGLLYEGCLALGNRMDPDPKNFYMYDFVHPLPGDEAGAFHSSELWYVFHTLHNCWRPWTERDWKLADQIHASWAAFIKTGNPGWAPFPYIKVFE